MNNTIFDREELISASGVGLECLSQWEESQTVSPDGYGPEGEPLYSSETLARVRQLKKLLDLGYEPDDVQGIVRKVGLPDSPVQDAPKNKAKSYLTIGSLAEAVGISSRTIKHWEDKGIIDAEMRSKGGFRLYGEEYIAVCELVRDLQLFGYSLDEIKHVANLVRDYMGFRDDLESFPKRLAEERFAQMFEAIDGLVVRMDQLKSGISRWEDLLKKYRKEFTNLSSRNEKRSELRD